MIDLRLALWAAAGDVESLIDHDIPTSGYPLDDFCAVVKDGSSMSVSDLIEAFELGEEFEP